MPYKLEKSPMFSVLPIEFKAPLLAKCAIDQKAAKDALAKQGLGKRKGCYIFAIAKRNSFEPWYVGMADYTPTKGRSSTIVTARNIMSPWR